MVRIVAFSGQFTGLKPITIFLVTKTCGSLLLAGNSSSSSAFVKLLFPPMANLPEITGLFARLASEIERLGSESGNEDLSIDHLVTSLTKSLNLTEQSRVTILDTALSLMCFTAPQVIDSVIDCSVKTLVTVLSSSVSCKLLRSGKDEVLRIGGSISVSDFVGVMEACADVLGKMVEHGGSKEDSCHSLLYTVVRAAVMATRFRHTLQQIPVIDVQSADGRSLALSNLICYFPRGIPLESQELPLRLLVWYLNPQTLMQDVSQLLQDAVRRPFLCLKRELYEKMEWRSTIICLALSPLMFIKTRDLLHTWFLLTGLPSILELQVELALVILDVVSRPMWWGLSAEVGSKLPFSHSYFPYKHQLFKTFSGPSLSCGGFLELIDQIKKSDSQMKRSSHTINQDAMRTSTVDQRSTWAMAISFPDWFYFASALLFSDKISKEMFTSGADESDQPPSSSCSAAAAWYMAWIMEPVNVSSQNQLAECLKKSSRSLILKNLCSDKHKKATTSKSKLKKPKLEYDKEDDTSWCYTGQIIRRWLEEFQDMYTSYSSSLKLHEVKTSQVIHIQHNVMFRRITLGILIGSSSINEDACGLLLHYAATGRILASTENQHAGLKHRRWNCEQQADHITWIDECSRKEAVAGACIVFYTTDIAERMSYSIFETQELAVDFVCRVKSGVVKYLLKCVKRLLQFETDQDDGLLVLKDLQERMLRWRHQGKHEGSSDVDVDDAIYVIAGKLSSAST